jgi:serine/threonine protein phosphatase PrpC
MPMQPSHTQLQIRCGFVSETGRRSDNEDYAGIYLGTPAQRVRQGIVAAVADGVGGSKGGRVAAELAVRSFIDAYYSLPETLGVQHAGIAAVESFSRWIFKQGRSDPALENASCTFTVLILLGRKAHVLHVGDSRLYRLSGDRLERLTEDHTLKHPDLRHVLYRAIGIEETVRLDYAVHPLRLHDRFLLCSDGVHGRLNDARIRDLLMRRSAPEDTARQIVQAAYAAGSADNITAVVTDVVSLPPVDQSDLEMAITSLQVRDPAPRQGEEVDGFVLDKVLSEGRYSRLFKATDRMGGGRAVVIKFPQPAVATENTYRLAFIREAWVASRLRSSWIGEVIEMPPGRQSCLYSVMPFYDGETLEQRLLRKPRLNLKEGIDIAVKLGRAVTALHRAGIIHRDIKPDNVILERNGGLKLIDLGVVRLPRIEEFPTTDIPGTPSFMAPELFAGEAGDERSDQYALGVTIYRAFSGEYPYGEIEPFSRPRFTKSVPLSRYRPDLPAWLDSVLARATAVDPNSRFGDTIEFALELEHGQERGGPMTMKKPPLYERDPVRFWQCVSILLLLVLVFSLAR